jgi:hypothetical protein
LGIKRGGYFLLSAARFNVAEHPRYDDEIESAEEIILLRGKIEIPGIWLAAN